MRLSERTQLHPAAARVRVCMCVCVFSAPLFALEVIPQPPSLSLFFATKGSAEKNTAIPERAITYTHVSPGSTGDCNTWEYMCILHHYNSEFLGFLSSPGIQWRGAQHLSSNIEGLMSFDWRAPAKTL